MATFDVKAISPVYSVRDEQFFNRDFPAAQNFSKGAPVVLGTNGQITETAANPASILGLLQILQKIMSGRRTLSILLDLLLL